jgi:predicted MFS family arabinose efflux permease
MFAAPRDAFAGIGGGVKSLELGNLGVCKAVGCTLGSIMTWYYLSNNVSIDSMLRLIAFASSLCFTAVILSRNISLKSNINSTENSNVIRSEIELNDVLAVLKNCLPVLSVSVLFFLGRFNDGMITLFLESLGFSEKFYFLTIGIFNGAMIIVSPIFGKMLDSDKKNLSLMITMMSLIVFNMIAVSMNQSIFWGIIMLIFWGIQRAGSQITFMSLIFDRIPSIHYGLAAGIYSFLSAISTFICSCACGYLQKFGFNYVFKFSCLFAVLALIASLKLINEKKTLSNNQINS